MGIMEWTPTLSVNVKQFDDQHVQLVAMVNELYDAMKEGKGDKQLLAGILGRLAKYTATHFAAEEQLMRKHAYPKIAQHRLEHSKLIEQVHALQKKLDASKGIALPMEVMQFLKSWLVHHIQGDDKEYGAFFNSRGIC